MVKNIILYVRRVIPSRRTNYSLYRYLHIIFRSVVLLTNGNPKGKKNTFLYLWRFRVSWWFAYKFTIRVCIRKRNEIRLLNWSSEKKESSQKYSNQNYYPLFVSNSTLLPFHRVFDELIFFLFIQWCCVCTLNSRMCQIFRFKIPPADFCSLFSSLVNCIVFRGT